MAEFESSCVSVKIEEFDSSGLTEYLHHEIEIKEEIFVSEHESLQKELKEEKPIIYECYTCQKKFSHKSKLSKHMKGHNFGSQSDTFIIQVGKGKEKVLLCKLCNYQCPVKSRMQIHVRTHTVDVLYLCNICDYQSTNKQFYNKHVLDHTGGKPFSCEVCDYKCSQKSNLKRHRRIHTGEKPFACELCDHTFRGKSDLKRHSGIHTVEKPFDCDVCGFKFSQKRYLRNHLRKSHAIRSFLNNAN